MKDREYMYDMFEGILYEAAAKILMALCNQELDDKQCMNEVRRLEREAVQEMDELEERCGRRVEDVQQIRDVQQVDEEYENFMCNIRRERRELLARERSEERPDTAQAPAAVDADETGSTTDAVQY